MESTEHRWVHPQCANCWIAERGLDTPVRVRSSGLTTCCYCGKPTVAGIFRRAEAGSPEIPFCPPAPDDD